jgi:hypothetical protein
VYTVQTLEMSLNTHAAVSSRTRKLFQVDQRGNP